MMTDRQLKLASYHARKVAERQQLQQQSRGGSSSSQQQQQQQRQVDETSLTKPTATGEISNQAAVSLSSTLQATTTTIQAAIASSNNNNKTPAKNVNNISVNESMNRDAMKQLFASRRRRALAEMQSQSTATTTRISSSTNNYPNVTAGVASSNGNPPSLSVPSTTIYTTLNSRSTTTATNAYKAVALVDAIEKRGGTILADNTATSISEQRRMSGDECSSSSSSSISTTTASTTTASSTAILITSRSRRALDRYLGKGTDNGKRRGVEVTSNSGGGGSSSTGNGSIASKSTSHTTHNSSSISRDTNNNVSAVIAKVVLDGEKTRGNALAPHPTTTITTTTNTAAAAPMRRGTVMTGGTKHEISSTATNVVTTKNVTKSVRFKLSPMRLSDQKRYCGGVDNYTSNHSESNDEEKPQSYDQEEGMEQRPYDEKEEWTNNNNINREFDVGKTKRDGHDAREIKTQCSPPRSSTFIGCGGRGNVTSGNDDEGRVWKDAATESEDEEEDDTEFAMFVEGLRREVAGDHTELWAEFQTLLGRSPREQVPLCMMLSSHDGSDKMKKRKIKMDPRTQNSLTAIHRHLMEDSRVKSNFMTASSQLVNDKKFRKGRVKMVVSGGDGIVHDRGRVGSLEADLSATKCATHQRRDCEIVTDNCAMTKSVLEVHSAHDSVNSDGGLRTHQQQQQQHDQCQFQDKRESWLQSYKDKKSSHLSGKSKLKITTAPSPKSNNDDKVSFGPIKHTTMNSSNSLGDGREDIDSEGGSAPNNSKRRLSWMEALKAKQKNLRSKKSTDSEDNGDSTGQASQEGSPISPLSTLQISSPQKKKRPFSPTTPKGAPWLNVHLRSTPKSRSSMATASDPTDNQNIDATQSSPTNNFTVAPTNLTSHYQPSDSSVSLTLSELCCVGDIIDLDALPQNVFSTHEGEATILPLKQSAKEPSMGGGEVEKVVIVGRTALATATIITPSTIDAPRKASVTWWCRRSDIRTLTLNVEATGVNLAHVHGRTPLLFDSADVCLDFAQTLYRGQTSKCDDTLGTVPTSNGKGGEPFLNSDERMTNGLATNLTNDEGNLLDCYRQYSQSERAKLRLTCLSPQGELQEMEVNFALASELSQSRKDVGQFALKNVTLEATAISPVNRIEGNSSLSTEEEDVASKYRKMLKMGIPPEAVQHKMTSDEIQPKIMAAVLDDSISKSSVCESTLKLKVSEGNELLTSEDEVIAEKYRKMLKMGVPLDGVRHKMAQDSVPLKIVSVLVREASPSSAVAEVESNSTYHKNMSSKINAPLLSDKEEAIATKYRNMLKVCIPKDAVRHKMKQDGIINRIVEAVLGKDALEVTGSDSALSQPKTTNRKTIAFHWTTSNLAPELLEQSIFGRTELKKRQLALVNPEESDIRKLEEIFQKRTSSNTVKTKSGSHDEDGNDMAKLLDLTRANNIAISLKSFNDFTFQSLAETIGDLDPECRIVGERVQFLPNLLPTPKEMQSIKRYKGDDEKLITAELFFRQLVSIKRIDDKVQVMQAMSSFEEHIEEVRAGLKTLQEVCSQVMNSEKLIQVLEMVLNVGNLMNAGTLHGGVEAFKFESLPKLSETKSADGKTTVLDYIVETFIEKGERQALFLLTEFPTIQDSSRLSIGDLMNDMISLRNDFKLCTKELSNMKRDQRSAGGTKTSTKVVKESEKDDPRKALFSAILSRGSKEDDRSTQPPDPRKALFAAITKRKADNGEENVDDSPDTGVEYTPGVHRLQKFLIHSKSILSIADNDLDSAIRACKGLALYCGEDGGERAAASLLQVLSSFALSLESGVKKYDQRVEAEKKRAARKNDVNGKENNNKVNSVSTTRLLKSSSFQPHVGLLDKGAQKGNPMNAILTAIKDRGSQLSEDSPGIETSVTTVSNSDSRQALLASIKNRRGSFPNKPSSDGVPDRIQHINNNIAQKESRVLLVNRMLAKAPPSVKEDFLKGVTYKETDDPLLRRIYDKESNACEEEENDNVVKNWKAVDPRQELFAAIKCRRSND